MQTLHRIVDTACLPVGIYVAQDVGAHVRQLIEFRIKLPCAAERNERKVIAASALIERSQPWYAIGASKQPHNDHLHTNRSEEHTSELQSPDHLVCRLLLEKKNKRQLKGRFGLPVIWVDEQNSSVPGDAQRDVAPLDFMAACIILQHFFFFFFNDTATTEIYTLSLHDALPI